jgi:exopolyphosphatase/guanosine-5'-triphosphate,3'-diphosphate pyrophosphatase
MQLAIVPVPLQAMRDAANGNEIIERIKKESGIQIEIIEGKKEAEIIYSNHIAEHLDKDHSYFYIDVGGGSTQITLFSGNKIVFSQSFNVGTIRFSS